jgi:multidrug resistance efflux pump
MNSDAPAPIPIPLRERWRSARLRVLPVLVIGLALGAISLLWKDNVAAPRLVGQAEPVVANVNSFKPGMLAELKVARFQKVKAGDTLGQVLVADPKVLASSLAVIQAEIEMLRVSLSPITVRQRAAIDYAQLRLDWMRQRAALASARVQLQLAETEFRRTEELFKDKIASQQALDQARAAKDSLREEVEELAGLVAEGERSFNLLHLANGAGPLEVTDEPLRAAIAVQESRLRLTEAELSPILLKAPMDGIVTTLHHRSGEAVTAGQPIVEIATLNAVRIVGYVRAPDLDAPKVGMKVEVRPRGPRREVGAAHIVEIGTQLEAVPVALLGPTRLASVELGLPVDISLPPNLKIRPGEVVDITLVSDAN